ncbi:MAG: hypothetical protein PHT58_02980 [Eubacteriales bacterium]|nr:hypothetical protein [Eubacteriales bacterium]
MNNLLSFVLSAADYLSANHIGEYIFWSLMLAVGIVLAIVLRIKQR